ncbi:hypothetical protein L7F22_008930 [Adiantum nelumboides]|nr:hypothetical protein [Adiantum nelumboides]
MAMQRKAWMNGELFQAWIEHFKSTIARDMGFENLHLLILDGHGSHVSLEVVAKAHDARIDIERAIWQQRTTNSQASKGELASIASKAIQLSFTEDNIKSGFRAIDIKPLDANAVSFDGMPCNHISIVNQTSQPTNDNISQVPCTPSTPIVESEIVHVLNEMSTLAENYNDNTISLDMLQPNSSLEDLTGTLSLQQKEWPPTIDSTSRQHRVVSNDENARPLPGMEIEDQSRTVNLLRVPITEVYVRQPPREAFVDYTNSLILTSDQYKDSMKAKNSKKEEIAKAREQRKMLKDKKRLEAIADREARQQQKEKSVQAKLARKQWEAQQVHFENQLRETLWGQGPQNSLSLRPLHVDQPHQALARRLRLEKLRQSRHQS